MPVQVNPGWIWSKSLSDIPMVYPVRKVSNGNAISDKGQDTSLPRDWNQGIEREYSVVAKDSEAHWQDDLTRWKNRRRSTKSELYRRSLEREHIVKQLTNGAVTNYEGNKTPGGPIKRDQSPWRHSSSPRPYSVSSSRPLSSDLRPHTRVLLTHSNATEAPFSSQSHSWESQLGSKPESGRSIMGEEPNLASLASDGRNGVTTPSLHQAFTSPTQVNALETPKSHLDSAEDGGASQQESAGVSKYLSRTTTWSSSASLPRGYRRSEGSTRLSSAITAKPFGAKSPRMSSLPRQYSADGGHTLMLNTEDSQSLSTKPYLKRQNAAAHLRGQYQASVRQKKANQSSHNESLALPCNASADLSKVDHSDMRVSLTLSPNSVPDFGFHIHWDATGVRIKFIQPGSPAEHCQLCVDDEVVAVNGVAVAHMTYSQWKAKMASSLQTGSLTMDIRRYGIKGRSDHHDNNAASVETTDTQESQLNGQTDNVTQEKTIGGLFSGNNTNARRKGGSETAISDIEVPSLNPSSSSWSWDREEDRRRQEKWQEEQERLLQEQYQRDQERLQAEWQRAQQDAMEGEMPREDAVEMACGRQRFASSQLFVNGLTKETKEKLKLDKEDQRDAEPKPPNIAHEAQNDRIPEKDWAEGSHGFAQLSHAHRAMSMSTPTLSGPYKQTRGDPRKRRGLTISKAERERQQILEEMKKRTQLLTDNSWIRQRSDSFHKEPIDVGTSMKSAWAAIDTSEEQRLESRFAFETGGLTVTTAISNSIPLPSTCDQHAVLQIQE
ncbi:hypothetical protein ILYODFUR_008625 [Ilyodon furcidens]|uniref:PDZ domain-containing protein n=1 Tax=Ilyodon furcidens TaxID=33524 RepID=A0ABV0TH16_9TELE